MTIDQRLLFFIGLSTLPMLACWFYFGETLFRWDEGPLFVLGGLVALTFLLMIAMRLNRQNRSALDWNSVDALWVGITGLTWFLPGAGRQSGFLVGAFTRNYNLEASAKYGYLTLFPILAFIAFEQWLAPNPSEAAMVSWVSIVAAIFVSFFSTLLGIGGFLKHLKTRGLRGYVTYRFLFAIVFAIIWGMRQTGWNVI